MTFRILLCSLVMVIALSTIILLYSFLYLSTRSTTPSPTASLPHFQKYTRTYRVVSNSEIKTRFDNLESFVCRKPRRTSSNIEYNNKVWQVVKDRDVFLYSAFYDVRYRYDGDAYHFVRIIASTKGAWDEGYVSTDEGGFLCHLWFPDEERSPVIVTAELKEIWIQEFNPNPPEDTYHSYLISCPVPHEFRRDNVMPSAVSVSGGECESLSNFLDVKKDGLMELRMGFPKEQYVVCVKGMNFPNDISWRVIEWMELLNILGAGKVDFYVYHVHENVMNVLQYYESVARARIINMTLPGDQPNDIEERNVFLKENLWQKRRNELVTYNDCLYRNMYRFNFILPLDIDEMIIPVKDKTWSDMFHRILGDDPEILRKYASFSVRNAYFFSKWNTTLPQVMSEPKKQEKVLSGKLYTNPDNYKEKLKLAERHSEKTIKKKYHMLSHLTRSYNFSLPGHNVKSFVSTKNSLLTFNHYTLYSLLPNFKRNMLLDTSTVQLNHYQEKCSRYILSQCIKTFDRNSQEDDIILKYSLQLKEYVDKAHESVYNFVNQNI